MSARHPLLANLLLSLFASGFFLGALEVLARLLEAKRPAPRVADYIWNWDEKMPGGFYTMRSEAVGWPPGEGFNRDGLRDRRHPEEKPEGCWRVAMLGDSVTLGAETEPVEAYPQVLEARLRAQGTRIDVMNVALWGWSTRQERVAYRRLLRKYTPDQVILGVCLNDIPELQNNLVRPPMLVSALYDRSAFLRWLVDAPGREIRSVEELFEKTDAPNVREAMNRFFEEVRALRAEVEADRAAFAVLVFPFRFQVEPGAPDSNVQKEIDAFCVSEEITCLDLLPALRKMGTAAFADYDHLSRAGSAFVAQTILDSGLLPSGFSNHELLATRVRGPAAAWLRARDHGVAHAAVADFLRALEDRDPHMRAAAAWALGTMGSAAADATPLLARALRSDESEVVRASAARTLGVLGPQALRAAPALFEALADPRQNVRWAAAQALSRLPLRAPDSVPALAAALRSEDSYVRGFAAWTLGNLGPAARDAIPDLIEALGQREGYGPGGASAALAKMGPAAASAVPALVRGLKDPDGERRWKAARTLGRIGPAARDAVPALIEALEDPHEFVRAQALRALGRIAPEQQRSWRARGSPEEATETRARH